MKLKTVLVAPDKFKGSLTAEQFCEIAKDEIKKFDKDIEVITCPLADGGEGSLDCFIKNLNAKTIQKKFTNANFERIDACYAIKDDVAFIECAETSGLLKTEFKNPLKTTTLGMGEQIFDAIKNGAKLIYLTLGGSATNDAGCGMAVGVGYKFFDENGNEGFSFPENMSNQQKFKQFGNSVSIPLIEEMALFIKKCIVVMTAAFSEDEKRRYEIPGPQLKMCLELQETLKENLRPQTIEKCCRIVSELGVSNEFCAQDISNILGVSQMTAYNFLHRLKQAGCIRREKRGYELENKKNHFAVNV